MPRHDPGCALPPAGELQEPSKKTISRCIEAQDQLVENAKAGIEDDHAD
jgi:hypothetical protein